MNVDYDFKCLRLVYLIIGLNRFHSLIYDIFLTILMGYNVFSINRKRDKGHIDS